MTVDEYINYDKDEPIGDNLNDVEIRNLVLDCNKEKDKKNNEVDTINNKEDNVELININSAMSSHDILFNFCEQNNLFENNRILDAWNLIKETLDLHKENLKIQTKLDKFLKLD